MCRCGFDFAIVFALWHRNVYGASVVRFLSRVSYSLYLVNLGWVAVIFAWCLMVQKSMVERFGSCSYLALSLTMAAMLYHTVEVCPSCACATVWDRGSDDLVTTDIRKICILIHQIGTAKSV